MDLDDLVTSFILEASSSLCYDMVCLILIAAQKLVSHTKDLLSLDCAEGESVSLANFVLWIHRLHCRHLVLIMGGPISCVISVSGLTDIDHYQSHLYLLCPL